MSERPIRGEYWVVVRVDKYDRVKGVGGMRVISWYATREEAKQMAAATRDPAIVALPVPFKGEPNTRARYKVPEGLDPALDREVQRLKQALSHRRRKDQGPKL